MVDNENLDDVTRSFTILKPGARVAQYRLIKTIGVGGMGEVYLAEDEKLRRKVALKFLLSNLSVNEDFKGRFLSEARSAASLNHPNIVTVYEISDSEDKVFIAMEYVEGKTLSELMAADELDLDYILDIAIQVCDGLSAAHAIKVTHRDIKPANILIDSNKRIRILDFGLAKNETEDNRTQDGTAIGTINYMSPEQCTGSKVDARSDIFSLGILLYEMLTKKQPFKQANIPATIYSIMNDEPENPNTINPEVTEPLWNVLKKAMAKKPEERYQEIINLKNDIINIKYNVRIDDTVVNLPNAHLINQTRPVKTVESNVKSLAVLYLNNIGPEENEYLSYGITEDLIVDLTRIKSFKIIPMRSIMKYKETDLSLEEIAEKLSVSYIVDGSIYKSGESIRLSISIFDVKTQDNLWAERWEEPFAKLPEIKANLAENISKILGVGTSEVKDAEIGKPVAQDAQAYDYFLKGKYLFEQRKDRVDVDKALNFYNQAILEEPSLLIARIGIAEIYITHGEYEKAKPILDEAFNKATDDNHKHNQTYVLRLLALLYQKQSDWENAMLYANRALEICRKNNDIKGEIEILSLILSILQPQLKHDEALIQYDRVLELSRELDDDEGIATALKNMGIVFSRKGDYTRALDLYEEALILAEKNNNFVLQAACKSNIGNIYYYQGELSKAFDHYKQAHDFAEKLQEVSLIARQQMNMGLIQLMRTNYPEGLKLLKDSSEAFLQQNDKHNYAMALVNMSQVHLIMGEFSLAVKTAHDALDIADQINQPIAKIDALIRLGEASLYKEDTVEALDKFILAKEITKKVKNKRNLALVELMITKVYYKNKDYENCAVHARKSQMIAKELGEQNIINMATAYLGALDIVQGLFNMGIKQIDTSLKNLKEIGNYESILYAEILHAELVLGFAPSESLKEKSIGHLNDLLKSATDKKMMQAASEIQNLLKKSSN